MRIMETLVRGQLAAKNSVAALTRRVEAAEGASAVEYALLVALIAVVIIAAVTLLGGNVKSALSSAATSI